jgi:hypothetical protein
LATIAVGFLQHESQLTMASIMFVTAVGSFASRLLMRLDRTGVEAA